MPVILILAVILAVVLIIVVKKRKTGNGSGSMTKETSLNPIELKEERSNTTIHYSDDFKKAASVVTSDGLHTATTLLMYKEDPSVWICPSCEAENTEAVAQCEVCSENR